MNTVMQEEATSATLDSGNTEGPVVARGVEVQVSGVSDADPGPPSRTEDRARDADDVSALSIRDLSFWYGSFQALFSVNLEVRQHCVTALIGPSGCGKTTLLRCANRINERTEGVRVDGTLEVLGQNVLEHSVSLRQLRKQVGMVFQRPNPLPMSIRDNVLFGTRVHGAASTQQNASEDDVVEAALTKVALWSDVRDRLKKSALGLSLEQQQKLCIARLLPTEPAVLLMDEPCSALDPAGTQAVEELIAQLEQEFSILIVTHNMAQARRVSSECAFMLMGEVVEFGATEELFTTPQHQKTADYVAGRFG